MPRIRTVYRIDYSNLKGVKRNMLTFDLPIEHLGPERDRRWRLICDCGTVVYLKAHIAYHNTKSCGCLVGKHNTARLTTHDMTDTAEYRCWHGFTSRQAAIRRGTVSGTRLTIANRWRKNFINFVNDMGLKPGDDYRLARRDLTKGYNPENCYWAPVGEERYPWKRSR